jgi:hypothetical protein
MRLLPVKAGQQYFAVRKSRNSDPAIERAGMGLRDLFLYRLPYGESKSARDAESGEFCRLAFSDRTKISSLLRVTQE